jgi:membrane-bound lytic murein transglycosylase A
MVHLQGSAILELPEGGRMSVGYAAATRYPFTGISAQYLRDRGLGWVQLGSYFRQYPDELNNYLVRNNRFVFFKENPSSDPIGSLGVPVVSGRSIATDKSRMPPGALALIRTSLPSRDVRGKLVSKPTTRFVLDHDTGSAIKGAGRVDLFMGSGPEAKETASQVFGDGELYYLMLKRA